MCKNDFTVAVGNAALEFRDVELTDPMPTGRQIIEAAGFAPATDFLIFSVSSGQPPTEVGLDETADIRDCGEKHFLVFESDQSWRALINGKRFEWGAEVISGLALKWLAGVDRANHGVWLELRDEPDRLIANDETVSLSSPTVERFRSGEMNHVWVEGERHPWPHSVISTEQVATLGDWDISLGVIEVDSDQNERELAPNETIELRNVVSFGKRLRFKRG